VIDIFNKYVSNFDINNFFVLDEVKDHYKLVYDFLEHKEKFKEMYEELIKYIEWRIKNEISY